MVCVVAIAIELEGHVQVRPGEVDSTDEVAGMPNGVLGRRRLDAGVHE
jgi:hypothetical protein